MEEGSLFLPPVLVLLVVTLVVVLVSFTLDVLFSLSLSAATRRTWLINIDTSTTSTTY